MRKEVPEWHEIILHGELEHINVPYLKSQLQLQVYLIRELCRDDLTHYLALHLRNTTMKLYCSANFTVYDLHKDLVSTYVNPSLSQNNRF